MNSVDPVTSSLYFSATAQAVAQAKKKEEEEKTSKKKGIFAELLREAQTESVKDTDLPPEIAGLSDEKALEKLLDNVYSSGDELRGMQTPEMVQKYKQSVKHFITFVEKKCYEVSKHESSRLIKNRHKFYQIDVVDKKLDRLAAEVLYNQRDQVMFLAKIDEINGLLVDLIT